MLKYVLKKCNSSCYRKDRKQLDKGYAVFNDEEPEVIKIFDDEQEALQELTNYETSVSYYDGTPYNFYLVTEYCVEIGEYDEEGEYCGDTVDYYITDFPAYEDIEFYA